MLPSHPGIILPVPLSLTAVCVFNVAFSVSLVGLPVSEVSFAVLPFVSTKALLHVVLIAALVLLSFRPSIDPSPVHFAFKEVSPVASSICHCQCPFAVELVGFPLSLVDIPIFHDILSNATLNPICIVSLI